MVALRVAVRWAGMKTAEDTIEQGWYCSGGSCLSTEPAGCGVESVYVCLAKADAREIAEAIAEAHARRSPGCSGRVRMRTRSRDD